jgi:DNA-binding transcriptional LysR family regulator
MPTEFRPLVLSMPLALDSDLLRTFVAVADTGNFTRAAGIVGRTQSAVSLQIKRLEDIVRAPLFERGPRGVELTSQGMLLLPNARRILGLMEETVALVATPPLNGLVRIGVPEEYSQTILPQALGAFAKRHPLVEVTVRFSHSMANRAAVEAGQLDLAVVYETEGEASADRLGTDPSVWATSELHAVHEQDPVPVALHDAQIWCRATALRALARDSIRFRIACTAGSSGSLHAAVTSGLAIAPVSRSHMPPFCRELGPEDGFGVIDAAQVGLVQHPRSTNRAVLGMRQALRDVFSFRFASSSAAMTK